MNILLLYPEFPTTFWSFDHALKFVRKRSFLPPLGLVTVAAMLPKDYEKRLIDTNVSRLRDKDLEWADLVFVSAMIVQKDSVRKLIKRAQEAGKKVVAGGPLFTLGWEDFPEVDHFVLDEAEITLPQFLADYEMGEAAHMYRSDEYPDIEESPTPLWELLELNRYAEMSIQYSRGCPFDCDFCNVTVLFGHRPRVKSAEQIIAELDGLYDLGWRGPVFFVDDNLIGNRKRLKQELLPALIDWQEGKAGTPFQTEVSIDLADDDELMDMMARAGFDAVFIGIETPSEEGLAECSKKQNRARDLIEDVKKIQRAGLQVQGGFIVGFDTDTPSIFQRQIDFIQQSGIVAAMVGILQALPGTKLYKRLRQQGRVREDVTGDNADGTTNVVPIMDMDVLQEGYERLLCHIYSPKYYYERVMTFLKEYNLPPITRGVDFEGILAFLRSVVRLGIFGKERFYYWKLIFWTLSRRPALFASAVSFAIYGYHFRKVCEAISKT